MTAWTKPFTPTLMGSGRCYAVILFLLPGFGSLLKQHKAGPSDYLQSDASGVKYGRVFTLNSPAAPAEKSMIA